MWVLSSCMGKLSSTHLLAVQTILIRSQRKVLLAGDMEAMSLNFLKLALSDGVE